MKIWHVAKKRIPRAEFHGISPKMESPHLCLKKKNFNFKKAEIPLFGQKYGLSILNPWNRLFKHIQNLDQQKIKKKIFF